MYDKSCILKNNLCYQFKWLTVGNQFAEQKTLQGKLRDIKKFKFLFEAVEAVAVVFPPIFSDDLSLLFTYKRYFNANEINNNGLVVNVQGLNNIFINNHLFKCNKGNYISYLYVCDRNNDCPSETKQDESDCE